MGIDGTELQCLAAFSECLKNIKFYNLMLPITAQKLQLYLYAIDDNFALTPCAVLR